MTTPEEAKFHRDKFVLTPHENPLGKDHITFSPTEEDLYMASEYYGVSPDNFKKIIGEPKPSKEFKKASKIFSGKIAQAEQFYEQQPIYYDQAGLWWLWNNSRKCWEITDEVSITNHLYFSLGVDTINSKERTEILQALKQVGRMRRPEPIPSHWIQFHDIIVDAITGQEIEASPDYFSTNPIPYKLHESRYIETPNMDRIFSEWVGSDYVKTLYQIIAYCLLPSYPIHRLFCLIGEGMNGKSCFLRLLSKFIGEKNVTATELDVLLKSRFEVAKLYKKLVCVMGETNFTEINQTSILKKLTGQDLIGFEYKNKNPFEDFNYAKIIIATNNLPTTTDKTQGFYRRWTIIDFPNQFSEEKDILSEIPEEEYNILAVKCLLILKDLLTERKFHNEGDVKERAEKYEAKSDFVTKFISDNIVEEPDGYITKSDFYKRFLAWSKENRHRQLSETSLSINLKKRNVEEGKKYFDWLYDGKGGQARVWLGIKWKG